MVKSKSDRRSVQHKALGNQYLEESEHFKALCEYNKALMFAESKENLALAYANRSAIYFELKKYDEAMLNIQWAREKDYPADQIQKLNDREEICKKLKEEQDEDPLDEVRDLFKLSYPPNPKIPLIVDCLRLGTDLEQCRRGVFATRDLKPGDIVAIESSIFANVHEGMAHIRCCKCLKMSMANLIPCTKTASLMFCSETCRDDTYANIKNLDSMITSNMAKQEINPERLLRECEEAFGGREGLREFLKHNDLENFKYTIFDFDLSNPNDPEYKQNLIKCVLSLNLFDSAFEFWHPNDNYHLKIKSLAGGDELIEKFLLRLAYICQENSSMSNFGATRKKEAINFQPTNRDSHIIQVMAFTPHMRNHCKPNTFDVPSEKGYITCVQKPIKAGEELFTNYTYGAPGGKHEGYAKEMAWFKGKDCPCRSCRDDIPDEEVEVTETTLMNELVLKLAQDKVCDIADFTPSRITFYTNLIDCIKSNSILLASYYSTLPQPSEVHVLTAINGFMMIFLARLLHMPCAPEKWRYTPYKK